MGEDKAVAAARRLAPALRERARKTEQLRRIPDETIADLQGSGLIRLLQPACYGGGEAPVQTYFDVVMALSAADASAGWVYSVFAVHAWLAAHLPRFAPVDEVWGDDPTALIGTAAPCRDGTIERTAEGYHVTGRFGFSSGCHHASWVIVAGVVQGKRSPVFLLVPKGDFEIDDNWRVMGLCGTGSCDLVFDTDVPPYRLVDHRGGCPVSDAPLYRLPFWSLFAHAVTVPLLGAAQGALDDYVANQRDRIRLFGGAAAAEPATHTRVAESAAELDAASTAIARNAADITAAAAGGRDLPPELLARLDRDQVIAVRQAVAAIDRLFADAGARALDLDRPLQRAWRDVHAGAAHGSNHPDAKLAAFGARAFIPPPTAQRDA